MRYILYVIIVAFTLLNSPSVHAEDVHYYLTAGMNGIVRMHDGNTFPVWGFREGIRPMRSISVPGPTIRAREGAHVFLHFFNMSMLPHTIHPHGLDVPQNVDGVPQTSFEIPMMGSYTYDFIAPHAGTYGYHCHVHTVLHLQMGMYGTIVIESPDGKKTVWEGGPAYDIERIWGTGEFDSYWHDNAGGMGMGMWRGGGFGMWMFSASVLRGGHGGGMGPGDGSGMWPGDGENDGVPFHDYNPDYFVVNGKSGTDIQRDSTTKVEMNINETLLLRLTNIGGYLPHRFIFNGLPATTVSSDGRPLPIQEAVDEITIYPGERYDVIIKPDSAGKYEIEVEYLSIYDESIQGTASVPIAVRKSF